MSDNTKSDGTGFALGVVFTLVLLAVALVFGIAMSSGKKAFAKKRVVAEQPVQVVSENAVIMLSELTSANATRNTTAVGLCCTNPDKPEITPTPDAAMP